MVIIIQKNLVASDEEQSLNYIYIYIYVCVCVYDSYTEEDKSW